MANGLARLSSVFSIDPDRQYLNIETQTGDGQLHSLTYLPNERDSKDEVIYEMAKKLKDDLVYRGYNVGEMTCENLEPIQEFNNLPASVYVSL